MPQPKYIVDAYAVWPDGATDAVYDIVEAGYRKEDGEPVGTVGEITEVVKGVMSDPKTAAWMAEEGVKVHVVFAVPASAATGPKKRAAREDDPGDRVVKTKRGKPRGVEVALNHEDGEWWVAVHVPPWVEDSEADPDGDSVVYVHEADSQEEAEKIYKSTTGMEPLEAGASRKGWMQG